MHQAGSIFPPALLVRGLVGLLGSKDPESGASTNVDSRLQLAEVLGEDGHDVDLLPSKRLVASRSRCNPEQYKMYTISACYGIHRTHFKIANFNNLNKSIIK
jgi:hypothetical protein